MLCSSLSLSCFLLSFSVPCLILGGSYFFPFFFAFSMLAKTCYYWYCFQSGCWQSGIRKILLESIWVLKDWFFAFMCWFNLCIYDVSRRELLINVVKLIETLVVVCKNVSLFVCFCISCMHWLYRFWFLISLKFVLFSFVWLDFLILVVLIQILLSRQYFDLTGIIICLKIVGNAIKIGSQWSLMYLQLRKYIMTKLREGWKSKERKIRLKKGIMRMLSFSCYLFYYYLFL